MTGCQLGGTLTLLNMTGTLAFDRLETSDFHENKQGNLARQCFADHRDGQGNWQVDGDGRPGKYTSNSISLR
jgi:hypothetical protein